MDKQGPGSPNTLLGDSDALSICCGTADSVAGRIEPGTAPMKRRNPLETAGMVIDTAAFQPAQSSDADIAAFMGVVDPRYRVPYTGAPVVDGVEHFPGCPDGRCQQIRAARTPAPVPLCYFPCCGATVKLVRTIGGGYSVLGKETHNTHCKEAS